eukprot:754965-Hanusia_phi.AAC.1
MIVEKHEVSSDLRREVQENRTFIVRILQAVEKSTSDCQSQTSNVLKRVDGLESRMESLEQGIKLQSEHTRSLLIALEAQGETVRDLREQVYSMHLRLEECTKDHKALSKLQSSFDNFASKTDRKIETVFNKLEEEQIRLERHIGESSLQAAKLKQELEKQMEAQKSMQDQANENQTVEIVSGLESFRKVKEETCKALEHQEGRLNSMERKCEALGSQLRDHDARLSEQLRTWSENMHAATQEHKFSFDMQLRNYKAETDPRISKLEGRLRSLSPDLRVEHSSKAAEQKAEIQARISRLEKAWPSLHTQAATSVVPKSYDGAPGTPTFDRMHATSYLDGTDFEISRSENTEIVSPPLHRSVLQ